MPPLGLQPSARGVPRQLALSLALPLEMPRHSPPDPLMIDFAAARRMMVDCQVRTSDVTDRPLIAAMQELPRERFLPEANAALAYLDLDVPVTDPQAGSVTRRLLKPLVLAKLLQAAEVRSSDHVLDVGCTTGYATAILARLARSVVALEEDSSLVRLAKENLGTVGAVNVAVVSGALVDGWPPAAPYDVILLNGATEVPPAVLCRQLKDGGRLVGVVGGAPATKAMLYRAVGSDVSGWPIFDAAAPLLPGFEQPAAFAF
jgi:protein-L-isoaspartate(D-aspartate) O-methyltransferase